MMRKLGFCLLPALLALALFSGCSEDDLRPYFTRTTAQPDCGVYPLQVEFYAIASGGNTSDDPTGANLNLDIKWDLGDDSPQANGTLVHHEYAEPGVYHVTVTVTDDDGSASLDTFTITVNEDTLRVWAEVTGDRDPSTPDVIDIYDTDAAHATCFADICGFNGDYTRFLFRWFPDTVDAERALFIHYGERELRHSFLADGPGQYRLIPSLQDVAEGITRRDTIDWLVTECVGGPVDTMTVEVVGPLDDQGVLLDRDPSTPNRYQVYEDDVFTLSFDADICGFDDDGSGDDYFRFDIAWFLGTGTVSAFSAEREIEFTFADYNYGFGNRTLVLSVHDPALDIWRRVNVPMQIIPR